MPWRAGVVIGADVVFWPESIEPLAGTLGEAVRDGARCWLALKPRSLQVEDRLDLALKNNGLKRELVQEKRVPLFEIKSL
jgi:hypothetical protein